MGYSCKILLDSISETIKRITTFALTYPRIIHSEFMTHRVFSRNAASSRAIPAKRMRELVINETFLLAGNNFAKRLLTKILQILRKEIKMAKLNFTEYILRIEWMNRSKYEIFFKEVRDEDAIETMNKEIENHCPKNKMDEYNMNLYKIQWINGV